VVKWFSRGPRWLFASEADDHHILYGVGSGTTILSWGGRPRDRLGSSICRYGVWYNEPYNCRHFQTNSESRDEADNCWNNVSKNDWNNGLNSAGFRLRHRLLFRLRWSERRSCRRSSLSSSRHLCRYFPANNGGYFEGHNAPLARGSSHREDCGRSRPRPNRAGSRGAGACPERARFLDSSDSLGMTERAEWVGRARGAVGTSSAVQPHLAVQPRLPAGVRWLGLQSGRGVAAGPRPRVCLRWTLRCPNIVP